MKMMEKIFFKQCILPGNTIHPYPVDKIASKKSNNSTQKIFSAANLWNIRRRKLATLVR